VSATVKLTDSIVDNNAGGYEGAAIFIHDGHASLSNNLIMSNTAGGALLFNSDGLINENRIVGNTAGNGGGVLILSGTATLLHNDILSNTAAYACGGGVCIAYSSTVTLTNNTIQGNTAIAYGGGGVGIFDAQALLRDNLIERNSVSSPLGYSNGGGVSVEAGGRAELIGNTIRHNTVSGSNWAHGGGVSVNANSAVTMTDNTIQDNSSNQVGGGVYLEGTTNVLSHNTLLRNHADNQGGGLYAANAITLLDTSVISNTAINDGGGAFLNGPAAIINGRFENNLCLNSDSCSGGGLYTIETLSLTDTQFISNAAGYAGGLDAVVKPVSIVGGQFERNTSQHFGGGLLALYGTVFMSGTVITGNIALDGYGGGVYAYGVTLLGARFINNVAAGLSGFGGGLNADFARIIDTLFIGNTASDAGGANAGHGYVIGGQFERNTSTLGNGGGLVAGYLFITGTRFISNNAFHSGGGVLIIDTGRIVNAVLANNTTQGDGAAVSIGSGGGVDVIHTTIAATNLNPKPAISILSGPVHLTDTIIASHTIGIDNSGGSVTEDYNLFFGNITNTVGVTSGGHSLVGDPRFVDLLHDNYHLLSNSPAIDHGIDAGVYTDLDGHPRPFGPGFDIGAYEFQGPFSRVYLPLVHK
jgi:parallel beta-helix repeat protein